MAALDTHSLAYIKGNQYLSFTFIIEIHGKVFMFGIRSGTQTHHSLSLFHGGIILSGLVPDLFGVGLDFAGS
jgi:hypothetical protein